MDGLVLDHGAAVVDGLGIVTAKSVLKLQAMPGGGYAISIVEASGDELKGLKRLPTVCQ